MVDDSKIISKEIYKCIDSLSTISQEEIEHLYKEDGVGIDIDIELKYIHNDLLRIIDYGMVDDAEESLLDNWYKHEPLKIKLDNYFETTLKKVITRFNVISNNKITDEEMEDVFKIIEANKNQYVENDVINEFINYLKKTIKEYREKREDEFNSAMIATHGIKKKERVYPTIETRNKVFCGTSNLLKIYAKIYYKKLEGKVEYDDIFQTAAEALLSACHYYVPTDKAKFTTYASRCIENKLKREYFKKKRKKRNTIEDEKVNIEYATMYYDSLLSVKKDQNGKRHYRVHKPGMVERLNRKIRRYNDKVLNLGYPEKVKITASRIELSRSLESILDIILKLVQTGKINMIISDEERKMLDLTGDYLELEGDTKESWLVVEYFKLYQKKLMDIELYLETEKELMDKSDGIVPTREEIIKSLNKKVKNFNSKLYSYQKDRYYSVPYIKSRKSYLKAYEEEMGVCILTNPEEDNSRAKEKEKIKESWEDLLDYYDDVLTYLEAIETKNKDAYVYYSEWEVPDDLGIEVKKVLIEESSSDAGEKMPVSEAIRIVDAGKQELENNEEGFVKEELKRRKDIVNEALEIYIIKVYLNIIEV